jgi:hypothetical protein
MLNPGQTLLLNNRLWSLRQVHTGEGRNLVLEVIGASEASQGMTRRLKAIQYGDELFIEQRRGGYWQAHLQQDWIAGERGPALNCHPATGLDLLTAHTRYAASGDLKNEFSWSYSRAAKYRQCPRAYYYHYYAAWEGWRPEAPPPVKRAYLLKNLTNLAQWVGTLVHDSLKFAVTRLKMGRPITNEALIKQMHRRARADFDTSQSGRYRQKPNQLTGFQEHYYTVNLPKTAWQTAWTRAEQYLRTFINSALYADLRRQPSQTFLDVETLQSFSIAGAKVWVQMDLARYKDEVIYLYDWKTGEVDRQELRQQLGVYALYVRHAWPEWVTAPIRAVVYALAEDHLLEFDLDETPLQTVQANVETSIGQLQGLLVDSSIQANLTELRRFPMVNDLSICRDCQFRELCGRER